MTTPATDANPSVGALLPGYDAAGHQRNVALRVTNVATDATTGVVYADLGVDVEVTLPALTSVALNDGVTTATKATVAAFHNQDNTTTTTGNGLLTSSVAQILNPGGYLDRQRGTGFDGIPAIGVATGTQQMAGAALSTTFNGTVTGNAAAQSVQVASSANAVVGDMVKTQDNVEYVEITAIADGTHITGIFKNNHASGQSLTWYHYNQARDASAGDNIALTGVSASQTYLYNNVAALAELERSAAGELDGASGHGTNIAAEYEYNGNPLANGSVLSGSMFDRSRNVQAGGLGSGTISNNPLAANSTSFTLNSGPTTLQPGAQIVLDRAGASPETNYVGTGYTAGSTTVPLQLATQFSHNQNATVEWAQHAPLGPQLNGFLPSGLGMEEEILYDPISKKYFVEIAATGDGNSGQNLVLESLGLYNGATFDRARGNLDNVTLLASAAQTTTQTIDNITNYNARGVVICVDTTAVPGSAPSNVVTIYGKDPVSGKYNLLLTGAAITAVGTAFYTIYPGATPAANLTVSQPLPRTYKVVVTAGNSNSATYSVGASYIL